ncbi:putative HECT-type ubiquitin ligase-interacting protein cred [Aspergillus heteromorphus CBS 117.55]|uniref:Carbon catabolite repressor D n=1 Tax=Aspergillus heteromorphus CBS 117.55 TaxID=1448321 RepID=A0A317VZD6_9EURO|nr:putative HECT-type ubiquitin ligase-interacting protein cred [Aspergillus heteromorphus CBS 117.55]PWY78327.1 putative HECT-type ubiquitin ligase-interacting protein cred [Aspergillus heteromorphus CBS 117.55]
MALSFFGGGGSASYAKYFDIRLDEDYIVFRGGEEEAASAHLSGKLILCLSEPLSIKHIRLHLTGISRVCWHLPSSTAGGGRKSWRERVFYEKTWRFRDAGKSKTEVLPAGNYEYPFNIVLEGSMPESVEGLTDTYVTYRFKAEIGRKYAKDIIVRRPLRIIRTLEPSALELAHAMSVENVWPNKIEYSISTPTKAVVFGTCLRVDFKLIPLLKGLRIGQIVSQLIESHDLTLNPEDPDSIRNTYKSTRTILNDEHDLDEDNGLEIIDEMAEGYQFTRHLELPKTLTRCLQDTDTRGIKIRHKLKFRVQLLNPDGHVSELRATLPVSIFISPTLAIDENNNLVDQTPQSTQRAVDDLAHQAPPLYGEHQFDQLYSQLDPSGYRTPGPGSGGAGTPFGTLSRNMSSENLASMNALTNTDISASALHSRLSSLRANGHSYPASPTEHEHPELDTRRLNPPPDYFAGAASGSNSHSPTSPELSRRPSDEHEHDHDYIHSGMATPYHPQYAEVETLSRVPSYSTAVRTTVRPCDSDLPDYSTVIAEDVVISAPQSPQQAYLRTANAGRGSSYFTAIDALHSRSGLLNPRPTSHDDEDRRLRLVQARARV